MKSISHSEFAKLPGRRHVDVLITFRHGPNHADIRHYLRDASVLYTLWLYPAFDEILVQETAKPSAT